MARAPRTFDSYITPATGNFVTIDDYEECPGSAFLKYTLEARDAIRLCENNFPRNNNTEFSAAARDSFQLISIALLPAIMGHFETFQKHLFAGAFEFSIHYKDFDLKKFLKRLNDITKKPVSINLERFAAYREEESLWVGIILADQIRSWHDPESVNALFKALGFNTQMYSATQIQDLKILWQLRHTIAHTGGTLSVGDAAKVQKLKNLGNTNLAFSHTMISEISRKFHSIIYRSVSRILEKLDARLPQDLPQEKREEITDFFAVQSTNNAWLPN